MPGQIAEGTLEGVGYKRVNARATPEERRKRRLKGRRENCRERKKGEID